MLARCRVVEFPTVAGISWKAWRGDGRLLQHVTRRPPRRAPCLARHYQVTMRASFQRVGPGKPGSQLPVGDG